MRPSTPTAAPIRRLLPLVAATLFLDTLCFSGLAPLLPGFVREHDMGSLETGLLVGADSLGVVVAVALVVPAIRARGPKPVMIAGLAIVAVGSIGFGFAQSELGLMVARLAQGAGSALSWAAGLTWLLAVVAQNQRGRAIGTAFGSGTAGATIGPAVGALSASVGTAVVFSTLGGVCLLLALTALRLPQARPLVRRRAPARLSPATLASLAVLVTLTAIVAGVVIARVPLALDGHGVAPASIGALFLVGGAAGVLVAPLAGAWSDRRGRTEPLCVGACLTGIGAGGLALSGSDGGTVALTLSVLATAPLISGPAVTVLAERLEIAGLNHEVAFAWQEVLWAAGHFVGALGASALAALSGEAAPFAALGAWCVVALPAAWSIRQGYNPRAL